MAKKVQYKVITNHEIPIKESTITQKTLLVLGMPYMKQNTNKTAKNSRQRTDPIDHIT